MATSAGQGTNVAGGGGQAQGDQLLCTPTFVFQAAGFPPGMSSSVLNIADLPHQQLANFGLRQLPVATGQQNAGAVLQTLPKQEQLPMTVSGTTKKGRGGGSSAVSANHHQQMLNTIAFPQQQQATAILIPATAASAVGRSNAANFNTAATLATGLIWSCPACKIPFKSATELQAHLSTHTKAEKSVPCQQCGKLFASAERVRIHIRVAHGEKSCSCEICGSGFSYRCKLLDHMRTHTGDKPFHCEVCNRSFSQKNHLRRHQMIHTGEKPFPCEICGRGFYRKDKLSRHRKIHLNPSGGGGSSSRSRNNNTTNSTNASSNQATIVSTPTATSQIVTTPQAPQATIQLIPVLPTQFRTAAATGTAQSWLGQSVNLTTADATISTPTTSTG